MKSGKSIFYSGTKNVYYPEHFFHRIMHARKKIKSRYSLYSKYPIKRHLRHAFFQIGHRLRNKRLQRTNQRAQADLLLICVPKHTTEYPPLGLAYLNSYLKKTGIQSKCIDFNIRLQQHVDPYVFNIRDHNLFMDRQLFKEFCEKNYARLMDEWVEEILSLGPRYVGFSLISKISMATAEYMANSIKERNKRITVIVGGPHCKNLLSEPLRKGYADIVVLGDGYESLRKIVDGSAPLEDIKGIIFKKNGEVTQNDEDNEFMDLNSLPFPDFSDFELNMYSSVGPILRGITLPINASLGCSRNCTFCTYKFLQSKFRLRSAQAVFEEMKYQKYRHGTCSFNFMDGMINADSKFIEELCDLIIKSNEIVYWSAQFGFKEDVTLELIQKMSRAGCMGLAIGLESGSENVRQKMLKPCSDKKVNELITALHEAAIPFFLNLFIGYPTETEEDFNKTMQLLEKHHHRITSVTAYSCVILPGSILSRYALKNKEYYYDPNAGASWSYQENTPELRASRMDRIISLAMDYDLIPKTKSGMF